MKTCPSCSKELPDYATKCKYCDHSFAGKIDFADPPPATSKRPKNYTSCVLWGLIAILAILVSIPLFGKKQTPAVGTSPTSLPSRTAKSSPMATTTPRLTSTAQVVSDAIPGLSPSDIKVNLEDRGFTCTDAESVTDASGQETYLWYCEKKGTETEYHVDFSSKALGAVEYIDASILQFSASSKESASQFLGFVATFAFLDSSTLQTEAKNWVSESLESIKDNEPATTTISGVKMELFSTSSATMITIQRSR